MMGSTEYSMMMDWSPVKPTQSQRERLNLRGSTTVRPTNQYESPSVRRYKQDRRDLQLMRYYDSPNRPIRVRNPIPQDVTSLTRKRKRLYVEHKRPTPVQDELERREQERIGRQKRQDEGDLLYTKALQASPFNDDTDEGEDNRDENLRSKRQRTTPHEEEVDMTLGEMIYETAQVTVFSICSIPLLAAAGLKKGLNALMGRQTEEQLPLDDLWWEPTHQIKTEEPPTTSQAAFDSGVELASVSSSAPSVSTDESSVGDADEEGTTRPQVTEDSQGKPDAQLTTNGDDAVTSYEDTTAYSQRVADTIIAATPHMDYSIEQEDLGQIIEKVESGMGQLLVERHSGRKTIAATPTRELRKPQPIRLLSSRYQVRAEEREKEREEERRKIKADAEKREQERLAAIKAAREAGEKKKLQRILPDENFIQPLNAEWVQKIQNLMKNGHGATLARTSAGIEIKLQSFQTLLPQRGDLGWLDDEIINGYMQAVVDFGNGDVILNGKRSVQRRNTPPKYHTFNSFFYDNLSKKGPASIARWSKRAKIDGEKLLQVEYIYIPLHLGNHWTLAVVSGTKKTIEYFDSLGGRPDPHVAHIKAWLKNELGDKWKEEEWKVLRTKGPKQRNGYDCGVFTVTTAKCIMLGIDPLAYSQEDIYNQRLRMAAELTVGGFVNEFAPPWPPGGGK